MVIFGTKHWGYMHTYSGIAEGGGALSAQAPPLTLTHTSDLPS